MKKLKIKLLLFGFFMVLMLENCISTLTPQKGYQALEEGDLQGAVYYFKDYLRGHPSDTKARNNLAVAYLREKNYDEAFKELQKVIAQRPDDAHAHYNLALVYYSKKLYGKEIEEYQQTLQISPAHYGAHLNLGNALLAQGHKRKAIEQFLWVLEKNPKNEKVLFNLGVLYKDLNERENAVNMLSRYLEAAPGGAYSKKAAAYLDELNKKQNSIKK